MSHNPRSRSVGSPQFGAIPFRLCLFFAVNPDEYLTAGDICAKYDIASNAVQPTLRASLKRGLLQEGLSDVYPHRTIYSAGPALREMVGA